MKLKNKLIWMVCGLLVIAICWNWNWKYKQKQVVNYESKMQVHQQLNHSSIMSMSLNLSQFNSYLSMDDIRSHYSKKYINSINTGSNDQALALEDPEIQIEKLKKLFPLCQMENCFNFERCRKNFKIYLYPVDKLSSPISTTFENILDSVLNSNYYTNDPTSACLFIPSIDTLDRDILSQNYVRNLASRLTNLKYWRNGENHVIFNLYAGTWPSYNETELGFPLGKAILVKASMSLDQYRPNFDISIPLFHPSHPEKKDDFAFTSIDFPAIHPHLISFKGKRYVYGIGSEARNSIYHLHNGNSVVMVTTCKHGKNWKEFLDERCDGDNTEYEKYEYQVLLQNSTFCLVPRGRRLGSFRFLEALRSGCIPVLLSNAWVLPFSEVIDWNQCTINADERSLLQILEIVRNIGDEKIFSMRQKSQIIYTQYLSTVEKILSTTFEVLRDRIEKHTWRDNIIWNTHPGALNIDLDFADNREAFPFYGVIRPNFTAVIYVKPFTGPKSSLNSNSNTPLFRLIRNVARSKFVKKILIIWDSLRPIPKVWPETRNIPLTFKSSSTKSISQRFITSDEIETDAVFSLDENASLSTDEFDFAYEIWKSFPDRIVGYQARSHFWDEAKDLWRYSSKLKNDYSLILSGSAIYHVYYNSIYWLKVPAQIQLLIESNQNCEDILINFLVVKITGKSPIKLTHKKYDSRNADSELFKQKQNCLNELANYFGSVPLMRSTIRLDPTLFLDEVSNYRKKYRQIEDKKIF